jgi:hypothetical protein
MDYNGYKPGFIYVLKSGPYYKIGFADDIEQRMKSVGNSAKPDDLKEPIELFFSFPTQSKLIAERKLHDFFSSVRVKGEWFCLADRHLDILRRFVDGYSVDQFVIHSHRLPTDLVLFSNADIQFCRDFGMKFTYGKDVILPEELEMYIERERASRARESRAKKYHKTIAGLLEAMSVEDLEWLYESIMMRGVVAEEDAQEQTRAD